MEESFEDAGGEEDERLGTKRVQDGRPLLLEPGIGPDLGQRQRKRGVVSKASEPARLVEDPHGAVAHVPERIRELL